MSEINRDSWKDTVCLLVCPAISPMEADWSTCVAGLVPETGPGPIQIYIPWQATSWDTGQGHRVGLRTKALAALKRCT